MSLKLKTVFSMDLGKAGFQPRLGLYITVQDPMGSRSVPYSHMFLYMVT